MRTAHSYVQTVYLTSRPIRHKPETRKFLDDSCGGGLSPGPLFTNRCGITGAAAMEALRLTKDFKSGVLAEICSAYYKQPSTSIATETHSSSSSTSTSSSTSSSRRHSPFVLGFGNRIADRVAYMLGGAVPSSNVYIIDPSSVVRVYEGADGGGEDGGACMVEFLGFSSSDLWRCIDESLARPGPRAGGGGDGGGIDH
jgi:phosphatidate phosphatase PAH1